MLSVFVALDRSGSMSGEPWTNAIDSLNGSRSWIREADTNELRNAFFRSLGLSSYKALGKPDSLVFSSLRRAAGVNIINETTINNDQDIEMTISVL